ncbi:hypothetical protein [Stigmatella aurantiaca]|uniref:Conserved uncharacterized protein n=2 Tax=Stigmatella aurantiaca (strain DW4/3-1) TaxID=378806 RepID=E3FGI3_STIAD|nr:hypothetical protein [Stigmatella aurantiaca]ADO71502.1 conserved uncharacterized protein [Stigmatella aurantiaca DW4/3-1]
MSEESTLAPLSPRLEQILQALPDQVFADRLRKVYAAATQAIARLSDMDLVKYETDSSDDSGADLSLWEEMAPVIRDTVMDVNALLTVIRQQFPGPPAGTPPPVAPTVEQDKTRNAAATLRQAMGQVAQEITQLGEAMRNPAVVSDRWTLLAEIQRFRTTFREQIGDLVFNSMSHMVDVARKEVVPGYEADVKAAMTVRAIVADLTRILSARLEKVRDAEPEDVQWNAQQLQNELDAFGRTAAYRGLRAQDKRHIIESRGQVGRLAAMASPVKAELLQLVQTLDGLVRSLAAVNQRKVLIINDREVWAVCGVRLERAQTLLGSDPAGAARFLAEAVMVAQSLYGREPGLDAFLRKTRKAPLGSLSGAELRSTLETLQGLLASLGGM